MTIPPSVALVTGGNRGLGLETCRQLARQGHRVILTSRAGEAAQRAAATLQAEGLDVLPQALDVASGESIRRACTDVTRVAGRVDILINNAAILRGDGQSVFDIDLETFREVLETNVLGALEVSRAFAPAMAQRGFGRIVNVSSGAGQLARMATYAPAYSLSKAALNALTRLIAGALQGRGVLGQQRRPRLGTHGHGWSARAAITRARGRHDRVARDLGRRWPEWRLLPRSGAHRVVNCALLGGACSQANTMQGSACATR